MIQRITIWETNYAIHWIEIYPLDSTIHLLNKWGQIWKRVWKMTFFWSEIESGVLEPGGIPTTIIPRNIPPPRAPATSCSHNSSDDNYQLEATGLPGGFMVATQLQQQGKWVSDSQAANSSCTNHAPDVVAHLLTQLSSRLFTFYSYF